MGNKPVRRFARGSRFAVLAAAAVLAAIPSAVAAHSAPPSGRNRLADSRQGALATDCAPPHLGLGVGEGTNDPAQFPPTLGELRIGMLFVDFADVRGTNDPRTLYEAFVPRAVEWYRRASYDRLRLVVTPVPRWLTLSGTVAHYTKTGGGSGLESGLRAALEEAVAAADGEVDFSHFQALYLVLPSAAVETIGTVGVLISEEPIRVDGSDIRIWAWLQDESRGPELDEYLAHETGHILGLPDLYVPPTPTTFHRWDIMAWAFPSRGFFAWHRWKLGWLDPVQIACFARGRRIEATLTPLERLGGMKAIIVRRGRYAYVAEVREPSAGTGGGICKGGVVIYEVEFDARSGAADIRLRRARVETSTQRVRCGPKSAAPFGRGRGQISRVRAWGLLFEVLAALPDGSFRVRVAKSR